MPTQESEAMKGIVSAVHPILKEQSYRKRGNAFNRQVEPGLVHVIHFQMGAFQPPRVTEIPKLRPNLYGAFTVNLGVYLRELREIGTKNQAAFINEFDCQIRMRIGGLIDPPADTWWRLDRPEESADQIRRLIEGPAGGWFARFSTRDEILLTLESLRPDDKATTMAPPRLIAMRLRLHRGEHELAERDFLDHLRARQHPPAHIEVLARLARQHNFEMPRPP